MAGLFRKRQFKPWIASSVISKDKNLKSRVVKVLCRRSVSAHGSMVMLVSDGELSISAIFSEQAVDNALSNLGLERDSSWDSALLILHKFTLELKVNPGQDVGDFVLYVEKFNIWDLQPGYHAKFDVKYCMEHTKVREMMTEEIRDMKERACQSQTDKTGSYALTQLLEEMAKPSESLSQSSCDENNEERTVSLTASKCGPLTESLMEQLIKPFSVEEFLIPPLQAEILQNIPGWKPGIQSPSPLELEGNKLAVSDQLEGNSLAVNDQQFDVSAANTLSSPPENLKDKAANQERRSSKESSQDVTYLGISVTPPEHPDVEVVKSSRQSPGPINILFKHSNMDSQSQGTSSQWQEEVDSVRFSFEESCTTATQESPEESPNPDVEIAVELRKHVETVEKSNKQVIKESDGIKSCGTVSPVNLEKGSDEFVTKENLKKKICSAVSEKGLKRAGTSLIIKEIGVIKTDTPVTDQEETLGRHLIEAVSEEKSSTPSSKEIQEKIADVLVTKEKQDKRVKKDKVKERLEEEADNHITKENIREKGDILVTKEYSEESLDFGSPNAQSTQIDEVININTEDNHGNITENVEKLCDNTEENENDFQERNRTKYSEIESISQSLVQCECTNNISGSQKNRSLIVSQNKGNDVPPFIDDREVLVKDENVDSELKAKINSSQDNTPSSALSDVDKSIMLDYYSQNSSSPDRNWNNVLLRLAEKKKKLEALKYIANRISVTTDEHDKIEDSENDRNLSNNSCITEERKEDVKSVCADDGGNVNPADVGKARSVVEARDDISKSVKENLFKQAESTTNGIIVAYKLLERGEEIEEGNVIRCNGSLGFDGKDTLCIEKKSNLKEIDIESQSEIDTEDTGYPLDSLTLRDSCEENDNCLLPSDIVLEQTDLEADDRIHCENIAKYAAAREELERESDQSDLEIVGYSSKRGISFIKNEKNILSKEKKLLKKEELLKHFDENREETVYDNPLAPLYFETEYGSKKRSRRLYEKVVSCRQKDDLINSANKGDNSAVSSRINDNLANSNKVISERMTELFDAGLVSDRPKQDANIESVVVTEPADETEAHQESAGSSLNEDVSVQLTCGLMSKGKVEVTSPLSVGDKDKCNAKNGEWKTKMWTRLDENILKNVSKTADHTKWKFKKDVRIMLERCDRKKTSYVQENKRSTRSSSKCCNKPSDSENALQKPLMSGNALQNTSMNENTLQKALKNRSSLQKAKVKSDRALRESPETVCSMAVNTHFECCRSDEEIERRSSQQDHDKAISLLGVNDSSSESLAGVSTSSLKLSMKRIKGKYNIVSKREGKRHRHVSDNIVDSPDVDTEVRGTRTKKDKAKLKRKKAVLESVSDSSTEREIITNSTSNSSAESEIIAYSAAVVKFDSNTTEKKDQVLKGSNKIEITELSDTANSDSEEISLISMDESRINDAEMDKEISEKTEPQLEKSKTDKADTKNKVVTDRINMCSFEDQFKTWLKKGYENSEKVVDEGRECQKRHSVAGHSLEPEKEWQEIENKKNAFDKHSSTEMENCMENMLPESSKQTNVQGGYIFDTEEPFQNDQNLQPGDQVILSTGSPVQCTQPFEICPYPETQEFVPKLSETMVQTSMIESQTICNNESLSRSKDSDIPQTQEFVPDLSESLVQKSLLESPETCNNETLNKRSTFKDSDKTSRIPVECNGLIETTKELEWDSTEYNLGNIQENHTFIGKSYHEKIELTDDKQVNVEFQPGQANKKMNGDEKENTVHSDLSSVTNKTSHNEQFEHTSNNSIDVTVDVTRKTAFVRSVDDKAFTKLMRKSECQRLPSDFWAISKPEKLTFKVKPVKRTNIQRKRKLGYNSIDDTDKIKKQKCTDEECDDVLKVRNDIKVGLKQNERAAVSMVDIQDDLNDSLKDFDLNESPSKKTKMFKKSIREENVVVSDRENINKSTDSVKIPIKTYEPRKIFIDGHCFGNRVCWQNFIESPYSAPASGETKNKSDVEKTNKRKSKLDSSQGSQRKSSSSTVGENVNKIENAVVNRSSESLFSEGNEENEIHISSPDSVSLLSRKKMETSVLGSKIGVGRYTYPTRLKESVNIKTKSYSGNLKYTKVDGIPRFYREKDTGHEKNMKRKDSDCHTSENPRIGRHQRGNSGINSDTDRNLFDKACGKSKQKYSTDKPKDMKASGKFTNLDKKGPVLNEMIPVDKKLFIEDWLMKHKKIGEQHSSSQELSPPEIQTPGNSLPSHQPAVSAGGQRARNNVQTEEQSFLLHEDSTGEQQGKDNSGTDSSSSSSSDSIESEELNKPMSGAARYLLKFRKARKEKKRRKMLEELKSDMKNQAETYLKS